MRTLTEKVIASAKKRDKPGLYKDERGNLWQVYRAQYDDRAEWRWGADLIFPWLIDEDAP